MGKYFILLIFIFSLFRTNLFSAEYIAFSLKVAEDLIRKTPREQLSLEVFNLYGINLINGLIIDKENFDIILVGQYDDTRDSLTLDDFSKIK